MMPNQELPSSLRPKTNTSDMSLQKNSNLTSQKLPSTLKAKSKKQNLPNIDFSNEDENDVQRDIERSQAQLTSRGIEAIAGLPGDLINFGASLFGFEPDLPGSQKLKEFSENITQGYTKPKNEFEEAVGETFQDIALMALPGAKHYSFARNLGIPLIGNLTKQGLKYGNADEKSQAYAKIGTMIALDLLSQRQGGAKKYVDSIYEKARNSIPEGETTYIGNLKKSIDILKKELSAGGSRPTTKKSLEKISELKDEIKSGFIEVKRLAAYRPAINEIIDELGGFNLEVPKKLKPQAIRNLNKVKGEIIKSLDNYGEKFNPEFLKYNQSANEAHAAMQKSNLIANFLKEKIPYSPQSKSVQTLFSYAPVAATAGLAKLSAPAAVGAAAGLAGYQGIKVLHRVMNSPTLRKYYTATLKSAAAGNVPQATKNLKALDLRLQEENNKE